MFQILLWSPWKYRCGQRTVRMAVVACSQNQAVFARRHNELKLKQKLLDIRAELERERRTREFSILDIISNRKNEAVNYLRISVIDCNLWRHLQLLRTKSTLVVRGRQFINPRAMSLRDNRREVSPADPIDRSGLTLPPNYSEAWAKGNAKITIRAGGEGNVLQPPAPVVSAATDHKTFGPTDLTSTCSEGICGIGHRT
ncbi:hypothetical protein TNCV_1088961 [Trichonephila clavipes]|uniref:Uncharacterized protein n=1 Tax=Trichonephila clavipes TaxID=2585209 RepID=A0A8X6VR04_TRICX|nr:hypothetical protein TNCV_1088961 [Trichonephila clavipes]